MNNLGCNCYLPLVSVTVTSICHWKDALAGMLNPVRPCTAVSGLMTSPGSSRVLVVKATASRTAPITGEFLWHQTYKVPDFPITFMTRHKCWNTGCRVIRAFTDLLSLIQCVGFLILWYRLALLFPSSYSTLFKIKNILWLLLVLWLTYYPVNFWWKHDSVNLRS